MLMTDSSRYTVLILGSRAPIALELCRSFGKHNHRVLCGDSIMFPIARFSKYCSKYLRHPAPNIDAAGFEKFLVNIVKEEKIDHIIPTSEEAFHLSIIAEELACKVWVSDIDLMDQLHNKFTFIKLAENYFNVPETHYIADFKDYSNASKYVFKPLYSRFGRDIIIDRPYESVIEKIKKSTNWIAQKKIEGQQLCTYAVFDEGNLKSYISYMPKYLYKGGASMLFQHKDNSSVFERVKKFGEAINFTGQLSFDFIIENDRPYVIECNPRGTSGAHLLADKLEQVFFYKGSEIFTQLKKSKSLKFPVLFDKPVAFFDKEFRESIDVIFDKKDFLPALGQVLSIVEFVFYKLTKAKSMEEIMTYEFEYNGK